MAISLQLTKTAATTNRSITTDAWLTASTTSLSATIAYVVTDQSGLTGTTTHTILIEPAASAAVSPISSTTTSTTNEASSTAQ